MKRVLIIGGGLAGLSAAIHLISRGIKVELIEASPKLGGKAYSFDDSRTGLHIDNGQHLLMGCYKHTLEYLRLIGSDQDLYYPSTQSVLFNLDKGLHYKLRVPLFIPFPINFLTSILRFSFLSFREKVKLVSFFIRLKYSKMTDSGGSAKEWLIENGQGTDALLEFWRLIGVSALNSSLELASAAMFQRILPQMFLAGTFESTLLVPKSGLNELFVDRALQLLQQKSCIVSTSEKAESLNIAGSRVISVKTDKREINEFDYAITAIPPYSGLIKSFLPEGVSEKYRYSPIVSIHIKKHFAPPEEKFVGLFNSPVHWIFYHKDHLSLIISAAEEIVNLTDEELIKIVSIELLERIGIGGITESEFRIIRERRATFVSSSELENCRVPQKTKYENLFLAGDYTDTGLPSTIEGAVFSGKIAANLVLNSTD